MYLSTHRKQLVKRTDKVATECQPGAQTTKISDVAKSKQMAPTTYVEPEANDNNKEIKTEISQQYSK